MNLKLTALGAGLVLAGSAMAGNVTTFPPFAPESLPETAGARNIQRAPLNPDLNKGTKIFGYTTVDYDGTKSYVNFFSSNPRQLNRLQTVLDEDNQTDAMFPRQVCNMAGVWAGDAYYSYRMFQYSFQYGIMSLMKVDPATGDHTVIKDTWDVYGSRFPDWFGDGQVGLPQTLLWNPNKPNDLYLMVQSRSGNVNTALHKVSREDGFWMDSNKIKELPNYYFCATYGYDNQIYALTWVPNAQGQVTGTELHVLDPNEDYEIVSKTPITVNGQPWLIYYDNNLTMDYSTGELWWAAATDQNDYQRALVKIDPLNGNTESFGPFGVDDHIGGMYVEYMTADKLTAPGRVSNPSFTIDANGNNNVTISWTNPTTLWNRRNMNNLQKVDIYRDSYPGTPVGTVTASGQEGKAASFTDTNAPAGIHTYYIVPVNANGNGVPFKIDAFVGKDVPGPVTNLVASTPEGKTIQLSWSKPERGDNDGWFDDSDLTYTITRLPDNKNLGTTKETSFTDNTIDDAILYAYQITATNAQGTGSAAVSNQVLAGNAIVPPFETTFETEIDASRFSSVDRGGSGLNFVYDINTAHRTNSMNLICSNGSNDQILVSPSLKVKKGQSYRVEFDIYAGGFGDNAFKERNTSWRLVGGTAPTAAAMTDVHFEDPDHITTWPAHDETYIAYFTAPVDGEYYIGFNNTMNNEADMWLYVLRFFVDEAPADDLEARNVDAHLYLSAINDNKIDVEVYNNGDNDQAAGSYTVKLATFEGNATPEVFLETTQVPAIKSHESAIVTINNKMPKSGAYNLVAIVDFPKDGNTNNNQSPALFVNVDETEPLNVTVKDEDYMDRNTNIPFNHYYECTASQTIYTPSLTLLDKLYEGTPTITRIAWEGKSLENITDFSDTKLRVWMTQTDETGYPQEEASFIPVDDEPLFEGNVALTNGRTYAVVDFEEPFAFNPKRPIMVTVAKEDKTHSGWLYDWDVFDADWYALKLHSVSYYGASAFDPADPSSNVFPFAPAPVIHLAIQGKRISQDDSVDEVILTGNSAIRYNAAENTVTTIGYPMASVEVFNYAGQLVERVKVAEGTTSVRLNKAEGAHLIKVNGTDGTSQTLKAIL